MRQKPRYKLVRRISTQECDNIVRENPPKKCYAGNTVAIDPKHGAPLILCGRNWQFFMVRPAGRTPSTKDE